MKIKKKVILSSSLIFVIIILDRITKWAAFLFLQNEPPRFFLKGLITLVFAENNGAFLGMGQALPLFVKYFVFVVIPIVFCFYGIYYLLFKTEIIPYIVSLSVIIGGGLGNIYDRVFFKFHVIDFLHFSLGPVRTGILNVADLSVAIGVLYLIIYSFRISGKKGEINIKSLGFLDDKDELLQIIRESFLTVSRDFHLTRDNAPTNPAFMTRDMLEKSLNNDVEYFIIRERENPVGCVAIQPGKAEREYYIERLAVLPEFRHKGYGRLLVSHGEEIIKNKGGKTVSLGIIEENIRLKEWYITLGYQSKGIKTFDHLPFTVGFLAKEL